MSDYNEYVSEFLGNLEHKARSIREIATAIAEKVREDVIIDPDRLAESTIAVAIYPVLRLVDFYLMSGRILRVEFHRNGLHEVRFLPLHVEINLEIRAKSTEDSE